MPTLREIRQRLGWAEDQLQNMLGKAGGVATVPPPESSTLYHIRKARADLSEHIGEEPEPEPEPDVEPVVVFDPDHYSSTQELEDDPYGVFSGTEIGGNYSLDESVAYPGGSHSMRYDWIDQGCTSVSIGRTMPIPGAGTQTDMNESVQEVWIEMYVRWSSNFQQNVDPNCAADLPAHKLLFVSNRLTTDDTPSNHGRWALTWNGGGGSITLEAPQDKTGESPSGGTGINGHDYFDGEWHKVRLHLRQDPGLYWLEVDGEVLVERTGFTVDPSDNKMWNVLPGRNKDEGNPAPSTETLHWGKVSVWTEGNDPGW